MEKSEGAGGLTEGVHGGAVGRAPLLDGNSPLQQHGYLIPSKKC